MMDPMDIELDFKKGVDGEFICYSKSVPEVTGAGEDEDVAASRFWKAFDIWCEQREDYEAPKAV